MADSNTPPAHPTYPPSIGALRQTDGRVTFRVWAPKAESVDLHLVANVDGEDRFLPMQPEPRGYFFLDVPDLEVGTKYFFRLDGQDSWPDPLSRWQPDGVHKPSGVASREFAWTDQHWHGLPLTNYITYELHVGTFSPEGTFDGAIAYLDDLVDLGITAVELLPISQFPGARNWGYDGVHPSAAQNTYGGPDGLKRLVNACHERGLAVILDVVYNHIGPEGNYLSLFGHYFTDKYGTPWGEALNFDDNYADEVRRFFIESALYWIGECHIDALRLDAVHAIFDNSAYPFLQELGDACHLEGQRLNRQVHLIAESSLNDKRLCSPQSVGGFGLDGQWSDELHHGLHTTLLPERAGYYADFDGFEDLLLSLQNGFVYDGVYAPHRARRYGNRPDQLSPEQFTVFSQNHDQVGNRMLGERLKELTSFEAAKLLAGVVLLSPYSPMLFMGEEYGDPAPFQFFVSHTDPGLVEAVREGRKAEFASFRWQEEPPDPQSEDTFNRSKLNHGLKSQGEHAVMLEFYKTLIRLRKGHPALMFPARDRMNYSAVSPHSVIREHVWTDHRELLAVFSFESDTVETNIPIPEGNWTVELNSAENRWNGPQTDSLPSQIDSSGTYALKLPAYSFVVLTRDRPAISPAAPVR